MIHAFLLFATDELEGGLRCGAAQEAVHARFLRHNQAMTSLGIRQCAVFLFVFSALLCGQVCLAADKSGVSPTTISLPTGPGSIEGLGESFQPSINTGTAKYVVKFAAPPGPAGHGPVVALHYEGGGGNGPAGFGWGLSMSCVQRRSDEGIPTYGKEYGVGRGDQWINETREELVPQTNGDFFSENEGTFIRYRRTNDWWAATAPNGTRLEFGGTNTARVAMGTNVFCWLIEREIDTRGNTILYSYTNFPGLKNLNQKYLAVIRYGPGAPPWVNYHFVKFEYEDRQDWFEDCRAGFPVRTGKRLKRVIVGTHGPVLRGHLQQDLDGDGLLDNLVRRYELNYVSYAAANTHWSLLGSVQPIAADGVSALPASSFGYDVCDPPLTNSAAGHILVSSNSPPALLDDPSVELVDLNGDGLADLLWTDGGHLAYLNLGESQAGATRFIRWKNGQSMAGEAQARTYSLASSGAGGTEGVHLADMDADGLADLVVSSTDVSYFPNTGRASWGNRLFMSVQGTAPPSPFGEATVRTADVDFDKRMDIVQSDVSGGSRNGYVAWFNKGNQKYSPAYVAGPTNDGSGPFSQDFNLATVHIADLNGDRVPDVAEVLDNEVVLTTGLGYCSFGAPLHLPLGVTLDTDQMQRAKLTDVTGDGLADLVIERAHGDGELWFWVNCGTNGFAPRRVVTGLPVTASTTSAIRWADLNGNGTVDYVFTDPASSAKIRVVDLGELINCGSTPNLLIAITNGIGRVTLIGYESSTKYRLDDNARGQAWTNTMPFPVQVVSAVTNLDSLGHQYVSRFVYHEGFYDAAQKQFRGFARVEQIDEGDAMAPTLVSRSYFDVGQSFESMKGKLLRQTAETQSGQVFYDEETTWQIPPKILLTGTNGQAVRFAHPVSSARIIKELGQGQELRTESEVAFDRFGNQTTNLNYGVVTNGNRQAFDDERIVTTEFAYNTNAWIVRLPKRTEVKDENGVVISRTECFYDDETFSGGNLGSVTIGNLTMKREWVDPIANKFITSMRAKYDSFGNVAAALDPLAVAPGGAIDLSKGHVRELTYDPRFHSYPVTETVHVGGGSANLVFQAVYDEGFGTVTASTDFNGNQTFFGYDTFARLTSITRPGDSTNFATVEYDYALAVPYLGSKVVNYVETRQLDKPISAPGDKRSHYFISRQFVDGLGRKLQVRQEAGSDTPGGPLHVVVKEAVTFNQRLKPSRILNPFYTTASGGLDAMLNYESVEELGWSGQFETNRSLVTLNLASAHVTSTRYDATLREILVTNPDGSTRSNRYEPFLTRSYDENDANPASPNADTPMVHVNDGLGRLVRVDEVTRLNDDGRPAGSLRAWTTGYTYDLNDQLLQITDSQNNVKQFRYDGLKRKIFMNDPDRGVMNFSYDDASNLESSTDAKGQQIAYTYDGVNRIRTEDYLDEAHPFSKHFSYNPLLSLSRSNRADVVYFYDVPQANLDVGDGSVATAANVKGKLAYVWDLTGEEHTSFDSRDRVAFVVKGIIDPLHAQVVSYRTGFAYDSMDRLTKLTYPDNDEVNYSYNDRNLLAQIFGSPTNIIISNLVYTPSGQQREITYGNKVRTSYSYDNRLRLSELTTANSQLELVHFAYQFDGVSNIRSIEDRRPGSAVPLGDPRRNTQIFEYDDLYRITRVQYSFTLPGQATRDDGNINYRYDRIGNMLSQVSSIAQIERGLPVANLGAMDSGGTSGRFNRVGRNPGDQPGPHALTSITQPSTTNSQPRLYPYDANGNMLVIDGLTNTWDFKDRLIRVENDEMIADYTYDYTDRRITKKVQSKK